MTGKKRITAIDPESPDFDRYMPALGKALRENLFFNTFKPLPPEGKEEPEREQENQP